MPTNTDNSYPQKVIHGSNWEPSLGRFPVTLDDSRALNIVTGGFLCLLPYPPSS